jgi:hypothetical protein
LQLGVISVRVFLKYTQFLIKSRTYHTNIFLISSLLKGFSR